MSMPRGQRPPLPMKYRRRRTFAILALIVLVWGAWSGISAIGSMFNGGAQQAQAGEACAAGAVSVTVHIGDGKVDSTSFVSGEDIKIWYDVTNVGTVPCKFNVGSKATVYKITSGPETIWTSSDCKADLTDNEIVLEPNKTLVAAAGPWDQVYSSSTGCGKKDNQSGVTADGASYHLQVTVNNVVSTNDVQFTLN